LNAIPSLAQKEPMSAAVRLLLIVDCMCSILNPCPWKILTGYVQSEKASLHDILPNPLCGLLLSVLSLPPAPIRHTLRLGWLVIHEPRLDQRLAKRLFYQDGGVLWQK